MRIRRLVLQEVGPFDHLVVELPEGRREDRADVHLLIGPNGTGKTTILQAMAQVFTPVPTGFHGRVRSERSFVLAEYGQGGRLGWKPGSGEGSLRLEGHDLPLVAPSFPEHFGSAHALAFHLHGLSADQLSARHPRFSDDHALVFAYGAQRGFRSDRLNGPAPLVDNPLVEAGLFEKPSSDGAFVQWLLNLIAQQALAEKQGDGPRAAGLAETLARVAAALSSVTEAQVEFQVRPDLLGVNVVVDGRPVPHGQLPAGLSGLLTWVGDLLMRLDRLPWVDDRPVDQRSFVLLLDEVEVHLHPAWQRRVLPMVERLFPSAQIIAATHSPFVIQSGSDAWVHQLDLRDGGAKLVRTVPGPLGDSFPSVVQHLMNVLFEFSAEVEARWTAFRNLKHQVLAGTASRADFDAEAGALAQVSEELHRMVAFEVRQLERQLAARGAAASGA